jgi:NAD+ diphosphatase
MSIRTFRPTEPSARLGYAANALDRAAERRDDAEAVAAFTRHPGSKAVLIAGDIPILRRDGDGLTALFDAVAARGFGEARTEVFLGLDGEAPVFGYGLDAALREALAQRDDLVVTDLRSIAVQGLVGPEELGTLGEAKAVLDWHARHRFCANCGAPTTVNAGGWRRECGACGAQHFPRTDPVAIMLAHRGEYCLLGRQARFAPGVYSCLAGFIEPGETIEDAVRRETREEAGVICGEVTYFASQPWPFPSSLMIGCFAEALGEEITVDRAELEDARWFSRDEVAAMLEKRHPQGLITPPPIAIAHHLLRAFVERG